MITVKPANGKGYFWQWDTGQELLVEGAPEVHFGRPDESTTVNVAVVGGIAKVPDAWLQAPGALQVYAYDTDHTLSRCIINVVCRQKPDGYVTTPETAKTWGALEARIKELEDAVGDSGASDHAGMDITGAQVGQIAKIAAVDADGKPTEWSTLGVVTPEKLPSPDSTTDLVNYAAFQAAVPMVQQMGITLATVGQLLQVKEINNHGNPTRWGGINVSATVSNSSTDNELVTAKAVYDAITVAIGNITPHIGDNGNWYLGSTDTGKPSRGATGAKGDTGANGKDGAQGEKGADGKTPVRGTDYWTADDKQEIVNSVIAALPDGMEVSY